MGARNCGFSVEIDGAETGLCFSAAHFINGHPTCGRLHGHNFVTNVRIKGKPNKLGIVIDFLSAEESVRRIVKEMDHKILLARRHARIRGSVVEFETTDGLMHIPRKGAFVVDKDETTSELLASHILDKLLNEIGLEEYQVEEIQVGVSESGGRSGWAIRTIS